MTLPLLNPLTPESLAEHDRAWRQRLAEKRKLYEAATDDYINDKVAWEAFQAKWMIQPCATGCGNNAEPGAVMCGWCTLDARKQIAADRDDRQTQRSNGDFR